MAMLAEMALRIPMFLASSRFFSYLWYKTTHTHRNTQELKEREKHRETEGMRERERDGIHIQTHHTNLIVLLTDGFIQSGVDWSIHL